MPDQHSATVIPFRASRRRAPAARGGDRAPLGAMAARGDGAGNVVPLRRGQRGGRRGGRVILFPPPGGEAA